MILLKPSREQAVVVAMIELSLQHSLLNISSSGSSPPLPKLTFDSKLVMALSVLDRMLRDIGAMKSKTTMETKKANQVNFTINSELGEGRVKIDG